MKRSTKILIIIAVLFTAPAVLGIDYVLVAMLFQFTQSGRDFGHAPMGQP